MFRIDSSNSFFLKLKVVSKYLKATNKYCKNERVEFLSVLEVAFILNKNKIIGDADKSGVQARIVERDEDKMSSPAVLYVVQPEQALSPMSWSSRINFGNEKYAHSNMYVVVVRALSQKHGKSQVIINRHRSSSEGTLVR
jgi:hypothetical protein